MTYVRSISRSVIGFQFKMTDRFAMAQAKWEAWKRWTAP